MPVPPVQLPVFEPWQAVKYRRPILGLDTCPATQQYNWKVELRPAMAPGLCEGLDIKQARKLEYLELCELALAVQQHPNFVGDKISLIITGELFSEMSADESRRERGLDKSGPSGRSLEIDIYGQLDQSMEYRSQLYRIVDFKAGYTPVVGIALCHIVVAN
ncbi:MAG: hypothetical protein KBG15_18565 [Kofleriaceae bacterium]|nr:hypothetical protein [Kofleriaceae bacterium]